MSNHIECRQPARVPIHFWDRKFVGQRFIFDHGLNNTLKYITAFNRGTDRVNSSFYLCDWTINEFEALTASEIQNMTEAPDLKNVHSSEQSTVLAFKIIKQ